jgi:DNA topoisomerase-3
MILVITEKPSVALAVSKVLGAYKREDGYYEGSGYIVSWCVGHLVELAKPEDYDEKYAKWRYADLPILPDEWKTVVSPDTKKQFAVLKKLMHRKDVESVVNGCDAGREGESIFRMTYELAECRKPMLRLWVSSMEDSAIRDGFQNLRPGSDYDRLYGAAQSRSKADWLVGINATRLFTVQYGRKLTVGRVQTPTLAMLTERKGLIENFTKEAYYKVHIEKDGLELTAEEQFDKERADVLAEKCNGKDAKIMAADCVKKSNKPPKLYDLTTLQREANRYYGYTAKQTLDYTQKLYEAKLVTYPRTDSQYLTEDMKDTANSIVLALYEKLSFLDGVVSSFHADQMIDNAKVTDHHAIIPTKASLTADITSLGKGEKAIYMLIAQRIREAGLWRKGQIGAWRGLDVLRRSRYDVGELL